MVCQSLCLCCLLSVDCSLWSCRKPVPANLNQHFRPHLFSNELVSYYDLPGYPSHSFLVKQLAARRCARQVLLMDSYYCFYFSSVTLQRQSAWHLKSKSISISRRFISRDLLPCRVPFCRLGSPLWVSTWILHFALE